MKIGITERGDAGINFAWICKLSTCDGVILITKNITDTFINQVLIAQDQGHKIIVHCTCTGFGKTSLEPNVPDYKTQLNQMKKLIDMGFPANHCVLRIDPIFPTPKGILAVTNVLNYFTSLNTDVTRVRISVVDEYKHVKERYRKRGWNPIYGDRFCASSAEFKLVADTLSQFSDFVFETCAEDTLAKLAPNIFKVTGCISETDLQLMHIESVPQMKQNMQNRNGCHCLACKTELLDNRHPCAHNCVYCFWKNK